MRLASYRLLYRAVFGVRFTLTLKRKGEPAKF